MTRQTRTWLLLLCCYLAIFLSYRIVLLIIRAPQLENEEEYRLVAAAEIIFAQWHGAPNPTGINPLFIIPPTHHSFGGLAVAYLFIIPLACGIDITPFVFRLELLFFNLAAGWLLLRLLWEWQCTSGHLLWFILLYTIMPLHPCEITSISAGMHGELLFFVALSYYILWRVMAHPAGHWSKYFLLGATCACGFLFLKSLFVLLFVASCKQYEEIARAHFPKLFGQKLAYFASKF